MKRLLVFDTETSGLVKKSENDSRKQPYIVQYAHNIVETNGRFWHIEETINKYFHVPVHIPKNATEIHGITNNMLVGRVMIYAVLDEILKKMEAVDVIAGHNVAFDMNMLFVEAKRIGEQERVKALEPKLVDTMKESKETVQAKGKTGKLKNPKLVEAYHHFTGRELIDAHDAMADVDATTEVLKHLYKHKILTLTD